MSMSKSALAACVAGRSMMLRWCIVLCALGAGVLPLHGEAQAPAAPPAGARVEPPPAAPPEPATPPAGAPRSPVADEGFVPTEELAADEEVTFPVDI